MQIVSKSLVAGPQKDCQLDQTGPNKDQTVVAVQSLMKMSWLWSDTFRRKKKDHIKTGHDWLNDKPVMIQ